MAQHVLWVTGDRFVIAQLPLQEHRPIMPTTRSIPAPTLVIIIGAIATSWIPPGCTKANGPGEAPETSPVVRTEPTMLAVELPTGVAVGIDGQEPRAMPLAPQAIEPGKHSLVVKTACQTIEVEIDAPAHETTRIDRDRVPGLEQGTLEVTARDLEGKSLAHAVTIDDELVGGGDGTSTTVVPSCKYRVKVMSEGLGGFIEDIDFSEEARVEREIVLAPGPDVVRIHGGPFTLGPSETNRAAWTDEWGGLIFERTHVEVETFDLDRTEVTAEHWHECRAAAEPRECNYPAECEQAVGCPRRWYIVTQPPSDLDYRHCNTDLSLDRSVKPGARNHPMNCVARWEAEDFCRWTGKRLPTAAEWEYAARSGDDRREWPWGQQPPTCDRGRFNIDGTCKNVRDTADVCSHPKGDSDQGVCDLIGNVEEYLRRPKERDGTWCRGPSWRSGSAWSVFHECGGVLFRNGIEQGFQESDLGFRCANNGHTSEGVQ